MLAARHFDNHVSLNQILQLFYQLCHIILYIMQGFSWSLLQNKPRQLFKYITFIQLTVLYPISYTTP